MILGSRARRRRVGFGSLALAGVGALLVGLIRLGLGPLPEDRLRPPASTVVLDRAGRPLRFFLAPDEQWRIPANLSEVNPRLLEAVLAYEDQWFDWHPGVNPFSLLRALGQNLNAGRIVSGGSTLTMQVARMIEPKPRTYRGKLVEIFRALQLELTYSKREILTFYLNLAPYGGNIQGVAAASWLYFGKSPARLSPAEMALILALPQAPESRRPDLFPGPARSARNRVLSRLLAQGILKPEEYSRALTSPTPTRRLELPWIAPHLSEMLAPGPQEDGRIVSTIQQEIQLLCEAKLHEHVARLKPRGIRNGAVVVIENSSRAVRALVGSPDFFDLPSQGQVNAAVALRSPGSTLKPFLYARALDRGLLAPETLVPDVPMRFGKYEPDNYDDTYRGMVTLREALINSLNVPAVQVEAKLGYQGIWSILREARFKGIGPDRNHYGLALILGGAGVNLLELTNLYATLADHGRWRPCRLRETEPLAPGQTLFSPGSAFLITEILSQVKRPDLDNELILATRLPLLAWKTGTSYGRKDAWSIGYDPQWTVGVWVGNATGEGNPEIVGCLSAAPLLFEIFNALGSGQHPPWFARPTSVGERKVCALSGMIPGPDCPETKTELYLANVSSPKVCTFHRRYEIDDQTGYRLCGYCRQGRRSHSKLFVQWPREVANWMEANHLQVEPIPPHLPTCPHPSPGPAPQIASPQSGDYFLLRPGVAPDRQQIPLRAAVDNQTRIIYWFIDGELLWKGPAAETVFYLPSPGPHRLACMDEEGRKTSIHFQVAEVEK